MSDTDRLLATARAQRTLTDGCTSCGHSKVYCRCVAGARTAIQQQDNEIAARSGQRRAKIKSIVKA